MKKSIACLMLAVFTLCAVSPAIAGEGRGGAMGFIAGCCFGIRTGADYNEGKELHLRDWGTIIPFAGIVVAIWNGIDCADGMTNADLTKQYGSTFY